MMPPPGTIPTLDPLDPAHVITISGAEGQARL